MTSLRQANNPMEATGLDDYVTANNIAFSNANRIPTVKREENIHLKYRPDAKKFNAGEEQ